MKLRNKKTGKVIKLDIYCIDGKNYESLLEINEEWEDYEKPKGYWSYDTIENEVTFNSIWNEDDRKADQAIGNYFETEEEAEKAVRKLEAWKRLKDNGFRFNGWDGTQIGSNISYISEIYYDRCTDDMDFLFGGEE